MKKIILFALLFAMVQIGMAQSPCGGPQFRITASANYSPTTTTFCSSPSITVSGVATLQTCEIDPIFYGPCTNATLSVRLQRFTGIVWTTVTSQNINNGNSYSLSFTATSTSDYRINVVVNTVGTYCSSGASTASFTGLNRFITVNTPPSNSYRIDGNTVNSSTYLQRFECQAIQMDNITWAGSNSLNIPGVSPAATYQYGISVTKVGSPQSISLIWANGTPPSSINLKSQISTTWGSANLAGQYTVRLWVRNFCNTTGVSTTGLLQILGTPTSPNTTVSLFGSQSSNNTTSGTYTNVGSSTTTQSSPINLCGQQLFGCRFSSTTGSVTSYTKSIDRLSGSTWVNEYSSGDINVTALPTGDVSLAPLSVLANLVSNVTYRFTISLKNQCTVTPVTKQQFFRVITTCKTEDTVLDITGIDDNDVEEAIEIYPNPATNFLNIKWPNKSEKEAEDIFIIGVDGKTFQLPILQESKNILSINISSLPKGMYFLKPNAESGIVGKFMVE